MLNIKHWKTCSFLPVFQVASLSLWVVDHQARGCSVEAGYFGGFPWFFGKYKSSLFVSHFEQFCARLPGPLWGTRCFSPADWDQICRDSGELGIVWLHQGPSMHHLDPYRRFSDVATTLSKDLDSFESLSSPAWLKSQCHHEVTPALVET